MQIVDEPAVLGRLFHPAETTNDLRIGKMMREESRKDHVGVVRRVVGERIAYHPLDSLCRRRSLPACPDGVWVQIDASQCPRDPALCGPRIDTAQGVAIAASNVYDAQRPSRIR